jgi:DNA repair protein RadD
MTARAIDLDFFAVDAEHIAASVRAGEIDTADAREHLRSLAEQRGLITTCGRFVVDEIVDDALIIAQGGAIADAPLLDAAELRPYQVDVIADIDRAVAAGRRRNILVAPTGSGKTVIASAIIKAARAAFRRVLVLSHRREITIQTSAKLHQNGIPHGIIQAGFPLRPLENVQVASIQTLWRRTMQAETMEMPPADLLVIDEAHHCPATTYRQIIDSYPDATLLGLTATPCRGDGRGLGGIFDTLIECPQVAVLIEQGYLVKTRVYAPVNPDLKGVRVQAGDYMESQLADRMDNPKLIGDIVTHWHKYGEHRKTVAFAVNVGHSIHLRDEFMRSGVRAKHIDGSTPKPERDATLARLASGEIDVVTNCLVLTEGWDLPEVGCCILARPTRKMGLYRQMIGRVLRPAEGKADAIILDHSGAVYRHGFAEDHVEWTLNPDRYAESPTHTARSICGSSSRLLECSQCSAIRVAGEPCSHCGFLPQRPPRSVFIADGELGLVKDGRAKPAEYSPADRARWYAMLTAIAIERGYRPGWAAVNYREKFGAWPPRSASPVPIPPSPEVLSWVRSRLIAYAKRRAA